MSRFCLELFVLGTEHHFTLENKDPAPVTVV